MKKTYFGAAIAAIVLLTSLVWYGCKKDEDVAAEVTTGTIYGTVTDFATGDPIGNVNVKLKPSGETTQTGSNGMFEFNDRKAGSYSLSFSKAEYNDLDDDYVIELEAGRKFQRDVQMRKQIASLRITNMAGEDFQSLDFGSQESVTSKSFNIFNNGSVNISCEINYQCVWISSVSDITNPITPGSTVAVTVSIDRTRLSGGENSTFLHIVSNNGSNEVKVTAIGIDVPTVTTSSVTNITATTASCGGNVTDDGGSYITERGICWATTNVPTVENNHAAMGQGTGNFTCNMTNLDPDNVYYVRAYATNSRGTAYGEQKQFSTTSGLPTVTINNVSNIAATSATCGGSVSDNGGFAVTGKGLVWSTAQYPTLNDNHLSLGSGNAPFTGSMTNLSMNTTYYVRAYATNSQGTAYSSQQTFTTANGLPTVTTTAISVSGEQYTSGGNVTSDGGYAVTARGICYGVYPHPDLSGAYTHTENGTGTGYFTSVIDGPVTGTIYVRAYATNANGTAYGNEIIVSSDYLSLPTFTCNGHTYRVAPDPHTSNSQDISWDAANAYCQNLMVYGYSDWRMPTLEELEMMYQNREAIGGFIYPDRQGSYNYSSYYHSSTLFNDYYHYKVNWGSGYTTYSYENGGSGNCVSVHVRPIRMEN